MRDNQPVFDAEIDLNDYLDVIMKKKKIMIIVFLIILFSGTLINLLTPTEKYFQSTAIFENPRIEYLQLQGPDGQIKIKEIMNLEESMVIIRSAPFLKALFNGTNPKISTKEVQRIIQKDIRLSKIFGTHFFKIEVNSKDKEKAFTIVQEILRRLEPISNDALKEYISNSKPTDHSITIFRVVDPPLMPDRITKVVPNKKLRSILLLLVAIFFAIWSPFIAEFFERRKHRQLRPWSENTD